jgi:hypothetical protein
MSMRLWIWPPLALLAAANASPPAPADDPPAPADPAPTATATSPAPAPTITPLEAAVLRALASNPSTAPYPFATRIAAGRLELRGVVGTKAVHDIALRTAMAYTPAIDDRLVIDTAATLNAVPGYGYGPGAMAAGPPGRAGVGAAAAAGAGVAGPAWGVTANGYPGVPYVYPPPLFGYWDEPFYGFEPPTISYPPWWPALSARRRAEDAAAMASGAAPTPLPPSAMPPSAGSAGVVSSVAQANASDPLPPDTVEMSLDPRGVAVLRGTVGTLEERIGLGKKVAETPGITEVINLIDVRPSQAPPPEADQPPPPPAPMAPPAPAPAAPGAREEAPPPISADAAGASGDLGDRVGLALARSPALAGHGVTALARGGTVTLRGVVPSAFEAMVAYRAAEQTPGVRAIDDEIEFPVPEPGKPNPLAERGRPEDVEPYLEAQVRRQVGDDAHIDRVRLNGESLQVRGSLKDEADRPRIEAVLRSMPLLRGFRLEPSLQVR